MKELHETIKTIYHAQQELKKTPYKEAPVFDVPQLHEDDFHSADPIDLKDISLLLVETIDFMKLTDEEKAKILQVSAIIESQQQKIAEEIKASNKIRTEQQDYIAELIQKGVELMKTVENEDEYKYTSIRKKHFNAEELQMIIDTFIEEGIAFLEKHGRFIFMMLDMEDGGLVKQRLISALDKKDVMGALLAETVMHCAQHTTISLYTEDSIELYYESRCQ